jgi:hypothetical protein
MGRGTRWKRDECFLENVVTERSGGGGMFVFDEAGARRFRAAVRGIARALPPMEGPPIRIETKSGLRGAGGAIHAGAFLRERRITFDPALERAPHEFARIFVHELFHFAWIRLGNPLRRSYEEVVGRECARSARGELGWSAAWRKEALSRAEWEQRTRRWREYVCESFCDTAAWRFAGLSGHPEFTLTQRWRPGRRDWFAQKLETKRISI